MTFEWAKVGTSFNILWLFNYPQGGKAPPEESSVKGKSFLEVMDVAVSRIHHENGGLGIPNSFLYWHWAMVGVFLSLFSVIFWLTTPLDDESFPYMTLVHKSVIFFNVWESLGLGVIHGPLHQKMAPPFQDWWYRLTPGTIKYNPTWIRSEHTMTRNWFDVLVEGILTYVFSVYALMGPTVTPARILPLTICTLYEFLFDYGQHMVCCKGHTDWFISHAFSRIKPAYLWNPKPTLLCVHVFRKGPTFGDSVVPILLLHGRATHHTSLIDTSCYLTRTSFFCPTSVLDSARLDLPSNTCLLATC